MSGQRSTRSPLRLGLTGGIGSGKSTVARLFQARGATVIDADAISRACTEAGGSAMSAIESTFGSTFVAPDGSLDRQRMREHVFVQPHARKTLEAIIHPLVGAEVRRLAEVATSSCLVFDVPLLVESPHWRHQLDRVLVVDCSHETQVRRVTERNGWERSAIEAVIKSQCPRDVRLAAADMVLFNDGREIDTLQQMVTQLVNRFGL